MSSCDRLSSFNGIGSLTSLQSLDIARFPNLTSLPQKICNLTSLKELTIYECHNLKSLPQEIRNLTSLKELRIYYCPLLGQRCKRQIGEDWPFIAHVPRIYVDWENQQEETISSGVVVRMEGSGASCNKKKKAKSNGGPSQLKELHNLGGKLIIENLGYGKDGVSEYKDANLKDRQLLQQLCLKWGSWDGESDCDEMLEGLQPHPNLKALELQYYMGVRIPSWVSSLTNLVDFELWQNRRLQHLPLLNQLPFLKFVSLMGMEALEYISDEDSVSNVLGASSSSSSSSKTPFFPSLSTLNIRSCPKLKGWWRNEPQNLLLPSFPPSLSNLVIWDCPNLTSMPPFPYLKESLRLRVCSWKVLEQTMKMKMKMGAATTSTYFPLSQLQLLKLYQINDFESLPEEGLRNLVSLGILEIQSCDGLVSLPWIGSLTSLQFLYIWGCPNLTSLPQEIRNLTSLKELEIRDCPLLGQRCKRQIGEDWPFIAHVPRVLVDGQEQREETISSEPSDAKPSDAEPCDAEPSDIESDAEPSDAESDAEPSDAEPTEDTSFCLCFPPLRFVIFWRTK